MLDLFTLSIAVGLVIHIPGLSTLLVSVELLVPNLSTLLASARLVLPIFLLFTIFILVVPLLSLKLLKQKLIELN